MDVCERQKWAERRLGVIMFSFCFMGHAQRTPTFCSELLPMAIYPHCFLTDKKQCDEVLQCVVGRWVSFCALPWYSGRYILFWDVIMCAPHVDWSGLLIGATIPPFHEQVPIPISGLFNCSLHSATRVLSALHHSYSCYFLLKHLYTSSTLSLFGIEGTALLICQ